MNKREIKKIKDKLLERKRELLRSIQSNLDSSNQASDNRSSDPIDVASDSFEDDLSMSLAGREAEELASINDALDKIEEGTYGECEECGKPIPAARLKALPFASMCIKCKEQQEIEDAAEGNSFRPKWE